MAQSISMTQIPPEGVLKLYGGVEIGGGRQKIFKSKTEQRAYFNSKLVMSFNDLSYIRLGDGIQIETDTVSISNCNYLSFINKTSGVETEIYAEIDPNWEYVNPNTVRISYTVDWWQTCMHAGLTMKEGIVRREHMNETDWAAAIANPYADIYQLQTSEDLPMDESMEKIAQTSTGDISIAPALPLHQSVNMSLPEDMRLVLILGQSNLSEIIPDPNASTYTIDYIISQITANGGYVRRGSTIQNVPNACTIFVMKYDTTSGIGPSTSVFLFQKLMNVLEYNALTGNIVGLYWIPHEYVDDPTQDYVRHQLTPVPDGYAPRNPKLYRAPYCYLRVSDETGQYKHYQWEKFQELVEGVAGQYVKFDLYFSQTGMPVLFAAPRKYKSVLGSTTYNNELLYANLEEALVHDDIPTLPFSTDGYLSALGSKMREAWSGNNPVKNIAANWKNSGNGDLTSRVMQTQFENLSAPDMLQSALIAPVAAAMSLGKKGDSAFSANFRKVSNTFDKGKNFLTNMATGTGQNLQKATVADNYNAGSSKGWAGYMRAPLRFFFQKVCPRADIVEQYDRYFDYFGYSSGRIGLPYIYNYIKQTGDQPHFATIDGDHVTYCQADVTVITNGKAPTVAARSIEAMLSAGVLFSK